MSTFDRARPSIDVPRRRHAPSFQDPELGVLLLPPAGGEPSADAPEIAGARPLAEMDPVDPHADVAGPVGIVQRRLAAYLRGHLQRQHARPGWDPIGEPILDEPDAEPQQLGPDMIGLVERVGVVQIPDQAVRAGEAAGGFDTEIGIAADRHRGLEGFARVVLAARQVDDKLVVRPGTDFLEAAAGRSHLRVEEPSFLEHDDVHRGGRRGQPEIRGDLVDGDDAVAEITQDGDARFAAECLEHLECRPIAIGRVDVQAFARDGAHHARLQVGPITIIRRSLAPKCQPSGLGAGHVFLSHSVAAPRGSWTAYCPDASDPAGPA